MYAALRAKYAGVPDKMQTLEGFGSDCLTEHTLLSLPTAGVCTAAQDTSLLAPLLFHRTGGERHHC